MKQYHKENYEKLKNYIKQWRKNNPNKVKGYKRKWREGNQEQSKKYREQWQLKNPKYDKQYKIKNKEKISEQQKQYFQTEAGKATNQGGHYNRRAKELECINTLTTEEWIDILKEYKFKCAYCGKEFTLFNRETKDHVIPISRGGHNTKENIVPACKSCNSKKHDKILIKKEEQGCG